MQRETGLGLILMMVRLFVKKNISDEAAEKILSILQDESEFVDMIQLATEKDSTEADLIAKAESFQSA